MDKYIKNQLDILEKNHNWNYKINVKFLGTENETNTLSIDKEKYNKIKAILLDEGKNMGLTK